MEVLKQGQYSPVPVEKQVAIIFAGGNGYLDDVAVEDVRRFEAELYQFLDNSKPEVLTAIREKRELNDEIKNQLKGALKEFKEQRFRSSKDGGAEKKSDRPDAGRGRAPVTGTTDNGDRRAIEEEARKVPAQV